MKKKKATRFKNTYQLEDKEDQQATSSYKMDA